MVAPPEVSTSWAISRVAGTMPYRRMIGPSGPVNKMSWDKQNRARSGPNSSAMPTAMMGTSIGIRPPE